MARSCSGQQVWKGYQVIASETRLAVKLLAWKTLPSCGTVLGTLFLTWEPEKQIICVTFGRGKKKVVTLGRQGLLCNRLDRSTGQAFGGTGDAKRSSKSH